jgi:hypothetical protein
LKIDRKRDCERGGADGEAAREAGPLFSVLTPTRAHIREKSATEEQRSVRRSFSGGGSQQLRPAAIPTDIFSKHALNKPAKRALNFYNTLVYSRFRKNAVKK